MKELGVVVLSAVVFALSFLHFQWGRGITWPEKSDEASVSVRVSAPRLTTPDPDRVMIEAPALVPEISNVPLSATSDESAMEPVPVSSRLAPESIRVTPV